MRACFPVTADQGLDSEVHGHFSSAPFFLIVDTVAMSAQAIPNCDPLNPYAGCNPFLALTPVPFEVVITGGIGDAAVRLMNSMGSKVLCAEASAVMANLALLEQQALHEQAAQDSHLEGPCGGAGHACSHHHA
jgi:predicted Fe-Mo cluster-binding NifX family protein